MHISIQVCKKPIYVRVRQYSLKVGVRFFIIRFIYSQSIDYKYKILNNINILNKKIKPLKAIKMNIIIYIKIQIIFNIKININFSISLVNNKYKTIIFIVSK